jgi:ABC-type lipoprotein export system ATPase subunit/GNAT superfamily N-acetyltransferase
MAKTSNTLVKSTRVLGHEKIVRLATTNSVSEIKLPRFSQVAKDDTIYINGVNLKKVWLESEDEPGVRIPILPCFSRAETIPLGSKKIALEFGEIDNEEKNAAYESLERFHYRSSPSLLEQEEEVSSKNSGRKAVLLAWLTVGKERVYVGYIELTMPLMMVGPRHKAFSRVFKHNKRGNVGWSHWSQSSLKANLNLIVRIARVVTHPTYRGIGLASRLVNVAEEFSRTRWHIGRRRPIFIEISAEMLNYFDFVSSSGFTYCGHTDGNKKRVAKDMKAMAKGQKISSGIMSLQKKYFVTLAKFAELNGLDTDSAILRLEQIAASDNPEDASDEDSWLLLRKIFRMPRPYYVKGLDAVSEKYLNDISVIGEANPRLSVRKRKGTIEIRNLNVAALVPLSKSTPVRIITDSFGLNGKQIRQNLLRVEQFTANSGNIYLFAGASGTGKTMLLDAIGKDDYPLPRNIIFECERFNVSKTVKPLQIPVDAVIIDYFSDKYGTRTSLKTLAQVGLSEAVPLVKPYWMLSKGQQYRVQLADLTLQDASIWLLDEFAADLDPITAAIISSKLREIVRQLGVIVIVAAANNSHFVKDLKPARILKFDLGTGPRSLTTSEYLNEFF